MDGLSNINHSYFFYPEVAGRSLEEIDLIFAKGYLEKISYVKAAKELPKLSVEDMERLAVEYGLTDEMSLTKKYDLPMVEKQGHTEHIERQASST